MRRAEGGGKYLGYFVWKITILRQKIIFSPILGGTRAGCAPHWIRPWIQFLLSNKELYIWILSLKLRISLSQISLIVRNPLDKNDLKNRDVSRNFIFSLQNNDELRISCNEFGVNLVRNSLNDCSALKSNSGIRFNFNPYLYNNTPSNAIVNAASDIVYRPVIEADDTDRCTEYMNFNLLLF